MTSKAAIAPLSINVMISCCSNVMIDTPVKALSAGRMAHTIAERCASGAPDSRSEARAEAIGRRLQAVVRLGLAWGVDCGLRGARVVGHGSPPRAAPPAVALGKTSPTPARHTGIGPRVPHGFCGFLRQWGLAT